MKYIQPMNCQEFADYLLTLKTDDEIYFGCDPGVAWPDEIPQANKVEGWYFAKIICLREHGSKFILLDYCGGEEAFAIPLNNYQEESDADDRHIVPEYVRDYFNNHRYILNENDYVFVEMEE